MPILGTRNMNYTAHLNVLAFYARLCYQAMDILMVFHNDFVKYITQEVVLFSINSYIHVFLITNEHKLMMALSRVMCHA